MINKLLVGALAATIGIGGVVYANGEIDSKVNTVDYKVESQQLASNKNISNNDDTNSKYDSTYRGCYGLGRHHRSLTDEEIKDLRNSENFKDHLGMTEKEYSRLTEAEKKDLFTRVKENRKLTDKEIEKLVKSGDYCHYYDMTREEYEKLTDKEKEDLLEKNEYDGYRHHFNRHNIDRDENRDYRNRTHYNRRGHHRNSNLRRGRGHCH